MTRCWVAGQFSVPRAAADERYASGGPRRLERSLGFPAIGEQVDEVAFGGCWQAAKQVAEAGEGIELVTDGAGDQGQDRGGGVAALFAADEEPAATYSDRDTSLTRSSPPAHPSCSRSGPSSTGWSDRRGWDGSKVGGGRRLYHDGKFGSDSGDLFEFQNCADHDLL